MIARTVMFLLGSSLVAGCVEASEHVPDQDAVVPPADAQVERSDAGDRPTSCRERKGSACTTDPTCKLIEGVRYDPALECQGERAILGCRENIECPTFYRSTVVDSNGVSWMVYGGEDQPECLPNGYQLSQGGAPYFERWQSCSGPLKPRCEDLSAEQCDTPRCAPLAAQAVDVARMCMGRRAQIGCISSSQGCGAAMTLAADPNTGERWEFTSTCLPKGWSGAPILMNGTSFHSSPWSKPCD